MNRCSKHARRNPSLRNRKTALLAGAVGLMLYSYDSAHATAYYFDPAAKKDNIGGGAGTCSSKSCKAAASRAIPTSDWQSPRFGVT